MKKRQKTPRSIATPCYTTLYCVSSLCYLLVTIPLNSFAFVLTHSCPLEITSKFIIGLKSILEQDCRVAFDTRHSHLTCFVGAVNRKASKCNCTSKSGGCSNYPRKAG